MSAYKSSKDVFWVDEGNYLIVVKDTRIPGLIITGVEAALWRLLHQTLNWVEIRDLCSALLKVSTEEGETQIAKIISHWIKLGLLEVVCV